MFETLSMQGVSIPPKNGNAEYLVMFLHGLGADANDLIGLSDEFVDILPNAAFISPNAPFMCDMAPMGRQWFSLQSRETNHMLTGIQASAPLLNKYIDDELTKYGLDISKLIIIGFSQGTMMALHTMLRRTAPCAAIIGYSGAIIASRNLENEITAKPPICLVHGDDDQIVPFAAMADAEAALFNAGVNVEAYAVEGLGHGISGEGIVIARDFLQRYVLKIDKNNNKNV
jgi:phospholipase/carboxylesterase